MVFFGERDNYFWVESDDRSAFLRDLLDDFPNLVMGQHLVNTSFDSGHLPLTEPETASGWTKKNRLTLSPVISSVNQIPFDQYDEWYVFKSPRTFSAYEVFVNYGGFSVHKEALSDSAERFWKQLSVIEPQTFLSEGDNLICATKNKLLRDALINWKEDGNP